MSQRITEFTEDVEVIQKLGDYPNSDQGLSADQLKEMFDRAPKKIKEFINTVVVPAVRALENGMISPEEVQKITAKYIEENMPEAGYLSVRRNGSVAGEAVAMYATSLEVVGAARYLDKVRVPVQVTEGCEEVYIQLRSSENMSSKYIAQAHVDTPPAGLLQVELEVGRWFAPGERIVISAEEVTGSACILPPVAQDAITVDWLRDTPGCGGWNEETGWWLFDRDDVRFTGELIFYDTLREEMLQMEENAVSCYPQKLPKEKKTQARKNIDAVADEDLRKFAAPVVVSTNINDEVYVRGAIHGVNNEVDEYYQGYKNLNFIPVIGGKTIEAFGASNFQTQNLDIMEYDYKRKPIVKTRLYFRDSDTTEAKSLTLSESTCFIRFSKFSGIASEMSDAKIAIYYSEDATNEYIPHSLRSDEPLVDYTRVINSKINVKHIYSTVLSMTRSADLKADDICETLGYYTENDGGGASYLITTSVDEKAHQETLSNGLYATLMPGDIINVKQLGAISHESIWYTPNDSFDVIQKAINIATRGVLIPEGIYKVSRTITVSNKNNFSIEAGNASINFEQTDENAYCIKCTGSEHLRFNLGVIRAATGGCLELYSADDSSRVQYIDVYFHSFQSDKNCVYVHGSGGWVSETRFYEGRVQLANNSEENTGFKIDGSTILIDHFSFQNIGFEGVRTGLHLIGPSKLDGGVKILECFNITNCRLLESLKTLIKTENYVRYINIITSCIVYAHYFDLSEKTGTSKITGFCAEKGGACLATSATITDGIIIPDTHERWAYINSKAIVDLSTYEDAIDSATDGFIFGSAVEKLKLSNQYGRKFGKNRFSVKLISKNENGFAIYDSSDCLICDGANMQSGDIIQFDWFFVQNDEITTRWIATKIGTMHLLESAE